MDPISQAALGAIAARAAGPRALVGPVLLVGAVAGAMPDIDIVFSAPNDFFRMVRVHRGITHSLFFALTAGPFLGWLIARWRTRKEGGPPNTRGWVLAVTAAVLSHPLLDVLTPYGTQLLQPFSDARFAIHAMPIIDPLYTGVLLIGWVWAARSIRTQSIAMGALLISSAYLALGWQLGVQAKELGRADLVAAGVPVDRIEAFPTILQPWQRQVVARSGDQDRVGLISMWAPCAPVWTTTRSASGPQVDALKQSDEGRIFDWFAMGWVHYTQTVAGTDTRLHASDLRYVLSGDASDSVFSMSARLQFDADGASRVVVIDTPGQRGADPSRLTQAMASVFASTCRSAQVAEGEGSGRLDPFHGKG
jgi:inner membrane protein